MSRIPFQATALFLTRWWSQYISVVDREAVLKNVYMEVEISAGYFSMLILANLIALTGLITNSAPVIIGAMLISPLMGPILSFGVAFITIDKVIWRKSVKKIIGSVVLTVLIAALATWLSPIADTTNEILSRTKPNLFDLMIAFLAGTAGSAAICTKRNALTIVPGVAIATAVIPPLSVTGFGMGTGNVHIAAGGFFLFFTNFVAIVISTCIVFYLYGFRPSMTTEMDKAQLRKRIAFLSIILLAISIPLLYTLGRTISEARLRKSIQSALKANFDKNEFSRLVTFSYSEEGENLDISALVNTVKYMKETQIKGVENEIETRLGRDINLHLEQVKVQPGGLKEESPPLLLPAQPKPHPPQEVIRGSREKIISLVKHVCGQAQEIISPSTIEGFSAGFDDESQRLHIVLKVKRDTSFSAQEILWLTRFFASHLNVPVDLRVETVPFVPLLSFEKGEASLSDDMKQSLSILRDLYMADDNLAITVETFPERDMGRKGVRLAKKRAEAVVSLLAGDFQVPQSHMRVMVRRQGPGMSAVKVSVRATQENGSH